jgi:uncharacterized protein
MTWFDPYVAWDIWLIFFVLGVIVPWRGRVRLRELVANPNVGSRDRILLYASTIAFQWLAVIVVCWRARAHGFSRIDLGLSLPTGSIVIWSLLGSVTLGGLQWLNLRRMAHSPGRVQHLRTLGDKILPRTNRELGLFLMLALTAGICEEFLYRGFAIAAFNRFGRASWVAVILSGMLFGLAHLYQGRAGLAGTMLLGMLFGWIRVAFGSLLPVILSHSAIDVVAGVTGPKYLLQNQQANPSHSVSVLKYDT